MSLIESAKNELNITVSRVIDVNLALPLLALKGQ